MGLDMWCKCNNCQVMQTRKEHICCRNHPAQRKLSDNVTTYNSASPFNCLIEHPGFVLNCLTPEVVDESFKTYKHFYGRNICGSSLAARRRHTAYRNLSRFIYDVVGRGNRYILPSCCVSKIREVFPDSRGEYTGFRTSSI